nr:hypothetical protein [Saccharothrix yanglingensis]
MIATDGSAADRLWPGLGAPAWHGVTTWYFRPPAPPLRDPRWWWTATAAARS